MTAPATTLASLEASFAKVFSDAIEGVKTETAAKVQRTTIASRKAELVKALETLDVERLEAIETQMSEYVAHLVTIPATVSEPTELAETQSEALMAEYVRLETIKEFLAVRQEIMKVRVFSHLDATVGVGKPGAVPVPSLGKQFKREGGGISDPTLNPEKLVALLGAEVELVMDRVDIPEEVIPARTEFRLNEAKLVDLVRQRPELLERIATEAVDPGKERTARFIVRNI